MTTFKTNKATVPSQWEAAFLRFVETGESDPEFDVALEHNAELQDAVDEAFRMQTSAAKRIVEAMKESERQSEKTTFSSNPRELGRDVQDWLAQVAQMSAPRQTEFLREFSKGLKSQLPESQVAAVADLLVAHGED